MNDLMLLLTKSHQNKPIHGIKIMELKVYQQSTRCIFGRREQ